MASAAAEEAIRSYLTAVKDPQALQDDDHIRRLEAELHAAQDPIARVKLHQRIQEASTQRAEAYEEAFVAHASAWAADHGISAAAFLAEGVSPAVLRRAGFSMRGAHRSGRSAAGSGHRVTTDQVRRALPLGTFTAKAAQEASGASSTVVRRVLHEELEAGTIAEIGPDPEHRGPGRAAVRYQRYQR